MMYGQKRKELNGYAQDTTNNRMELQATISGLRAVKGSQPIVVTTDSKYVKQGITEWVHQWVKKNWRNSQNKPVKNQDLWQELLALTQSLQVEWCWVKGHSGHAENERADALANLAIDTQKKKE